jgi:hypothetical protein
MILSWKQKKNPFSGASSKLENDFVNLLEPYLVEHTSLIIQTIIL